jgi:hypothetical protein
MPMRVLMMGLMVWVTAVTVAWAEPRPENPGLRRVREALTASAPDQQPARLRLDYQVRVVAAQPRVPLFDGFDARPGTPSRHGAPTHAEFMLHWTPPAFRSALPARLWRR